MTTILIAQPTTGTVVSSTVGYLMELVGQFNRAGIAWSFRHLELSDIVMSRNIFASKLLADPRFTHLLFIDSDMGFRAETILGLVEFDRPVVACACPKRYLGWQELRDGVEAEADNRPKADRRTTQELMDALFEYNVDTKCFDGSPWHPERKGRFLSVPAIGTGIMLIRRDVLEDMHNKGVARALPGHSGLPVLGDAAYVDFFSCLPTPNGRMIESEDISFCKRWVVDCGGDIWADIESRVLHFGMRGHAGRYLPRMLADFPELSDG